MPRVSLASMQVRLAEGVKSVRSTISMASLFAREANAQHLLLYRIKPGIEDSQVHFSFSGSLTAPQTRVFVFGITTL